MSSKDSKDSKDGANRSTVHKEGILRMAKRGLDAHKEGDIEQGKNVHLKLKEVAKAHAEDNMRVHKSDPKCKWGE